MSLKSLLSFSVSAIFTGLSLDYFWPSNIVIDHTFYITTDLAYNISKNNEVVDYLKEFHATEFRFTTEELATHPEVNAVVEFLREPLQAVIALGSNIDLYDCTAIADLLESCAVWSISANTTPSTARPFLHAINARVHRCVDALDKVKKQQHFLEQLTQRLLDSDMGFVIQTLPPPDYTSKHEAPAHDFSSRVSSFQASAFTTSRKLWKWNVEKAAIDEPLANIQKSFIRASQSISAAVAKCDVGFAEELPVLLRDCQEERSRLRDLC